MILFVIGKLKKSIFVAPTSSLLGGYFLKYRGPEVAGVVGEQGYLLFFCFFKIEKKRRET